MLLRRSGQTDTVSVRFRPKYVFVSVFRLSSFSAFGQKHFNQKKTYFGSKYLAKMLAETKYFGRKRLFRPKKCLGFGRNFGFFQGSCFGVSAKKLFRLPTWNDFGSHGRCFASLDTTTVSGKKCAKSMDSSIAKNIPKSSKIEFL